MLYTISFKDKEKINVIKENYTQYDEMIIDLEYNKEDDLIIFNPDNKGKLTPVRLFIIY